MIILGAAKNGLPIILDTKRIPVSVKKFQEIDMSGDGNPGSPILARSSCGNDAVFTGWQQTRTGEYYALYNITAAGNPSFGSTVTEQSLRKLNLKIPQTPPALGPVKKT